MANNIGKIAKNTTRPLDEYLKFVQQTFNTNDVSFNDIIKQLENIAKTDSVNYTEAIDLKNRLDLIPILKEIVEKNVKDVRKALRKIRDTMIRFYVKGDSNPYSTVISFIKGERKTTE